MICVVFVKLTITKYLTNKPMNHLHLSIESVLLTP